MTDPAIATVKNGIFFYAQKVIYGLEPPSELYKVIRFDPWTKKETLAQL